jgi:phage shock protein C
MKKTFYLDKANGKLFGVCAGISNYTGWDVTLVRVGLVLVTLIGAFPWTAIAYAAAALVAKRKPAGLGYGDDKEVLSLRGSSEEVRQTMRDIDRRMAEVETFVTSSNGRLAQEIDSLR